MAKDGVVNGDNCEMRLKVVVIGESTVGKTSILQHVRGEEFNPSLMTTIGIDFFRKRFNLASTDVLLEIWDTAGQERFYSMTSFSYRSAKGLIFVYDVTNLESFKRLRSYWIKNLDKEFQGSNEPIPMFLIGNKIDLASKREVSEEAGRLLKEEQSLFGFYETSAKTGMNVNDAFNDIAEKLVKLWQCPEMTTSTYSAPVPTPNHSDSTKPKFLHHLFKRRQKRDGSIMLHQKSPSTTNSGSNKCC